MGRVILAILMVFVAGCAQPKYITHLVPTVANPAISNEQAAAICVPQARLAEANARANAQGQVDSRNNQVTGYNCDTYGTLNSGSYQGSTNCKPQKAGQSRGFMGGLNDGIEVNNAAVQVGTAVLQSCLAQHGWRTENYCVENCR